MVALLVRSRGMPGRCMIKARGCCKLCPYLLATLLALVSFAPVAAIGSSTAQLQSLLILLDESGLRIERQLVIQASQLPSPEQEKLRRVLRHNAINSSAFGKWLSDTSADTAWAEYPIAKWFSASAELLAVTRFNDPRVLRAPQKGSFVHEAIVAKPVSRFLLRGPAEAASVEIFLPDISGTVPVLPPPPRGAGFSGTTSPDASELLRRQTSKPLAGADAANAATWSKRQLWSFDL